FRNFLANPKEKKIFYKLGIILLIGLFLLNLGGGEKKNGFASPLSLDSAENSWLAETKGGHPQEDVGAALPQGEERALEMRLSHILGQIKGAGKVEVAVTFQSSREKQYAFNKQSNQRSSQEPAMTGADAGDNQEESLQMTLAGENSQPILVQEIAPTIQGVLVVASGAGDEIVKQSIFEAVKGLLNVAHHRIVVIEGNQ
ncbi:MAG: hypothetical protein RR396_00975, partial [Clostridiales bacterium]